MDRTREVAEHALAEQPTGFAALTTYMHAALDLRVSAVIPLALGHLDLDDEELGPARERSSAAIEQIVAAAHAEGSLHPDLTFAEVGMLLVRLSRPVPGPVPKDLNDRLAHWHLDVVLAGLSAGTTSPAGPALSRAPTLRRCARRAPDRAGAPSDPPDGRAARVGLDRPGSARSVLDSGYCASAECGLAAFCRGDR